MEIFANQKITVSVGDNNVTLKKLSYVEILEIAEMSTGKTNGRVGYENICAHIDSWGGPDLDSVPVGEESFKKLSREFFDELGPHVMKLRGLGEEEKNE